MLAMLCHARLLHNIIINLCIEYNTTHTISVVEFTHSHRFIIMSSSTDSDSNFSATVQTHTPTSTITHVNVNVSSSSSSSSPSSLPSHSHSHPHPLRILLCVSGSVAAIKCAELIQTLQSNAASVTSSSSSSPLPHGIEIKVVLSDKALYFCNKNETEGLVGKENVYTDQHEWPMFTSVHSSSSSHYHRGDRVLHIFLRNWCDILLIAPLSANTLSTISTGGCHNLLTSIVRAWDWRGKRKEEGEGRKEILLAPAMNTQMWDNPFTEKQIDIMRELGCIIIPPQEKMLACGEKGNGAMASVNSIVEVVVERAKALVDEVILRRKNNNLECYSTD